MRASIGLGLLLLLASVGTTRALEAAPPAAEAAKEAPPAAAQPAPAAEPLPPAEPAPAVRAPEPPPAAAPSAPTAPAASPRVFTIGVRAAVALPQGDFAGLVSSSETTAFADEFVNAIPLTIELGLRVTPRVTFGGYFSYGPAKEQPDALLGGCAEGSVDCAGGWTRRVGAQLLYQLTEPSTLTPWIGAGIGYEWLGFDLMEPAGTVEITYKGMELFNLQLGADYRVNERLSLGPYAAMTFAKFRQIVIEADGASVTADFAEPKVHSWLMLGLRGGFDL